MQMSYLYASDFPFKNFCKIAQHTETIRKNVWEKGNNACSLSIRVQTTIFYVFMFFTTISTPKKMFSFRARAEKGIARHIDAWRERRGWDLVIFDWFVLGMRMQVILDSSFARPGSVPLWGGKKGEFRDWTRSKFARKQIFILKRLDSMFGRALVPGWRPFMNKVYWVIKFATYGLRSERDCMTSRVCSVSEHQ